MQKNKQLYILVQFHQLFHLRVINLQQPFLAWFSLHHIGVLQIHLEIGKTNITVQFLFHHINFRSKNTCKTFSRISSNPNAFRAFVTCVSPTVFTLSFSAWIAIWTANWPIKALPHSCIYRHYRNQRTSNQSHEGFAHFHFIIYYRGYHVRYRCKRNGGLLLFFFIAHYTINKVSQCNKE